MTRKSWLLVMVAAGAVVLLNGCATTGVQTERTVLRARDRVAASLVHISPVKEVYARGKREEVVVSGSGFIISPDGYVVTNEHVAGNSRLVWCVLSTQEEVEATVIGADPDTDIALLKLHMERRDLPSATLGSSTGLEPGQTVLALGSPHGLARSISMGIVSVTDRYLPPRDDLSVSYNTWIQTDAAINPGNSGGPLVNLRGEVVGVNTRKLAGADNVGFAIPIDTAREVIAELKEHGAMRRSWIGAAFQEMMSTTNDPSRKGVVVADVLSMSPAGDAGLRPGDIVTALNGNPLHARFAEALPAVNRAVAALPVDAPAVFHIMRDGTEADVTITPEDKGSTDPREVEFEEWGFTAGEVPPPIARRLQLETETGVMVSGAQPGSIAAQAGLRRGDILLAVDNQPIPDMETFQKAYDERLASRQPLVLLDVRQGALTRYVMIKQTQEDAPDVASPTP